MPRLPTSTDLGQPEVPVSNRPISTYRSTALAEGADALAQGVTKLGQGLSNAADRQMEVQDRLAQSSATTAFLNKKLELDDAAQKDPDYSTVSERYAQSLNESAAQLSQSIKDPSRRASFMDGLMRVREAGIQTTRTIARTKQKEADTTWINDQISTGLDSAMRAPDEESRAVIFDNLRSSIDTLASPERGSLTAPQAVALKKTITETYAERRAGALVSTNPTTASETLKPSGTGPDGDPIFDKTGTWLDYLPPDKRATLYEKAVFQGAAVHARNTADTVLTDADTRFQSGAPKDIVGAITAQESGGKTDAPTSVDGAVGKFQIMPDTFARYAKPGEKIDNPADNDAVGKRILADLQSKYPNDPQRVAVAYFSGEGNVAPTGSPTPYLKDTKDGNGKSVSSYVSDVTSKLGATPAGPQPVQTKADFYRQNYADIVEQARQKAIAERPNDQRYIDLTVSQTEQRMSQTIRQQELSYKADNDLVYQALSGTGGKKPISIDEMTQKPDVKAAWERMQQNSPQAALAIETKVMTANAKESDHDVKTYGSGFLDLFNRIHAPAGDPNRVTDVTQLYPLVGDKITIAGLDKLKGEIDGRGTPETTAVSEMKKGAVAYAKHILSFEADYGAFKVRDPKGEDAFNVGFLPAFYQALDAGMKAGKTPFQLLSKDSPDFIVDKLAAPFKRSPQQLMQDRLNAGMDKGEGSTEVDLTTQDGIVGAYKAGRIPYDVAADALTKGGFAVARPPVPVR